MCPCDGDRKGNEKERKKWKEEGMKRGVRTKLSRETNPDTMDGNDGKKEQKTLATADDVSTPKLSCLLPEWILAVKYPGGEERTLI